MATKHFACPMHPEVVSSQPGRCPNCKMVLAEATVAIKHPVSPVSAAPPNDYHPAFQETGAGAFYTCPMDPDVIATQPGECPKCGMDLVAIQPRGSHPVHAGHGGAEQDFQRRFWVTLPFVLLVMALSPNIQQWVGFHLTFDRIAVATFLIGTFVFLYGGWPFFRAARGELSHRNPAMMTLVAFAITVAYSFSVAATFLFPGNSLYWEMSTLISVFLLGHWLEMRAVRGATGALAELAQLIPPSAHKLEKDGEVVDVETSRLALGDRVLVKPGEKIPIDGTVVDGESSVEESMITGESRPISKKIGDTVIGGSINQDGSLTLEVAKTGAHTALAQIMTLVRNAQSSKPNVQYLADRAATVLFYIAVAAGLLSFAAWYFIFPHGAIFAATVAVAAIVVACPHALGLAIPTVTSITSTLGAKNGILIKDMKGLEAARQVTYVVFDKTGTLTHGKFGVTKILVAHKALGTENNLLKYAAAVDALSQHSIAEGIVTVARQRGLTLPKTTGFRSHPGRGASAIVEGKRVAVGNQELLAELKVALNTIAASDRAKASTPVYVAIDGVLAGIIYLADIVRDESKLAVRKLQAMGIKTAMLTGDTKDVADGVGKELEIDTVFAQVLPEDKVDKVKELQRGGKVVAMVGDGVNDAPSLAQAHVGIAIGAGTDVAVESADIVLMKNDPLDVVKAITLSRKTNQKMVQNLAWATGYNIVAIPVAAGVLYPSLHILLRPEWAALLMSASSVIVVLNALLLRRTKLD